MYCLKCKADRTPTDAEIVTMKNGRKAEKAKCSVCGTVGFRILKKTVSPETTPPQDAPPAPASPPLQTV